jgi:hypothetical protein
VIEDAGTKTSVFLEGLSRPEVLDRAVREIREIRPAEKSGKGETSK